MRSYVFKQILHNNPVIFAEKILGAFAVQNFFSFFSAKHISKID